MGRDLDAVIAFMKREVTFEDEDEERTMSLADAAALKRRISIAIEKVHEDIAVERAAQRQSTDGGPKG